MPVEMAYVSTKIRRAIQSRRYVFLPMVVVTFFVFLVLGGRSKKTETPSTALPVYPVEPTDRTKAKDLLVEKKAEPHSDPVDKNSGDYNKYVYFNNSVPLIWIGGVPRSGTTLMRALLDAHSDVRCGEETRVIPRLLGMHSGMQKSQLEMSRLEAAHISKKVLQNALGAYILSIITQHGDPAPRLCNKDPFSLRSMRLLKDIFPNSKFIFMVRDGRATAHSIVSRHVTIKGFDSKTYKGALTDWNRAVKAMNDECNNAGPTSCLAVHYEQLVLHPEAQMRSILQFLNIQWDEKVLHHEQAVGVKGGISLSK